ncbi:hypothetical protein [Rhodopseudomonas sp.]|uniref:hypothetical protein n=1 Tax=Rhodopseudomonas sp. TaxID=1078 RepID=UPI0039E3A68C
MSRRVILQAGGTPLKVGIAGADASNADAFDLLFSADHQPLRLWGTGYVQVPSMLAYDFSPANVVDGGQIVSTPAGTYPLFMVAGKDSATSGAQRPLVTVRHGGDVGFGALVANNRIYGINFMHDFSDQVKLEMAVVNYCILKNYG